MALNSLLARLGTSQPVEAKATLEELAGFDLSTFGRAPAHFDPPKSSRSTASCSTTSIIPQSRIGPPTASARRNGRFWPETSITSGSLPTGLRFSTAKSASPPLMKKNALSCPRRRRGGGDRLEHRPLVPAHFGAQATHGPQGGEALFRPLRLALTGRDRPEMAPMLARIGRTRSLSRLKAARLQASEGRAAPYVWRNAHPSPRSTARVRLRATLPLSCVSGAASR